MRAVEEAARVFKLDVETRINAQVSVHHPSFAWILRHATMLLNWRQPGRDGRTPHERLRGKVFNAHVVMIINGDNKTLLTSDR